jgi:DNA primase
MTVADEVKARLDIIDVISEHVTLRKAGRNYKGLCPFHSENTPSFFVFPETQTWHCFGACNTGGDVFTFVMKQGHLDFSEALQALAERAGVQLRQIEQTDTEQQKHLQKLADINAAAAAYYHEALVRAPTGEGARAYAARRGLNAETIQRFQLGFAPDDWRALSNHLLQRGYQREDLFEGGLIIARDDGGYYDRFRGRFMIPIRDPRGRVVGFGGRILDTGEPKYLNSPQTPLFNKSYILFGLDLAKGAIRAKGYVVIVEGYMDVLQAHQAGFGNVIATMGTALTEHQLDTLKRMTKRYVLALDPDLAGDQGTLRGLAVARQALDRQTVPVPTANGWIRYESRLDADIRIMTLPPGRDPDDLIRDTPELWEPLVEAAIPVVDYYFQVATQDLDLKSARGKSEIVRRLGPVLSEIRDQVEKTHYVQKLARLIHVDEGVVRSQLGITGQRQARRRPAGPATAEVPEPETWTATSQPVTFALEEHCLAVLFRCPSYLERVNALLKGLELEPLQDEDLERIENRMLFNAWVQTPEGLDWQDWVSGLPPVLEAYLENLLAQGPDSDELTGEDAERDIEYTVLRLRHKRLQRLTQDLNMLQAEALEQGLTRLPEYDQATIGVHRNRLRLERALYERTSLGKREEKQQFP